MPSGLGKSLHLMLFPLQPASLSAMLPPMARKLAKRLRLKRAILSPAERLAEQESGSVQQWLLANKLSFRDNEKWRLTPRIAGHVNGLIHFSGVLVATNGILCCIETGATILTHCHLEWFVAAELDDQDELDALKRVSKKDKADAAFAEFLV